ncbi:hypothetical protein GYMLUDRAFT_39520 [Collybiopsis luxurians FD-317 M1]|nr:hypothetical protein GYMLUDRAFT_39520 [Collybiopsis luxurians FD-317 M1]
MHDRVPISNDKEDPEPRLRGIVDGCIYTVPYGIDANGEPQTRSVLIGRVLSRSKESQGWKGLRNGNSRTRTVTIGHVLSCSKGILGRGTLVCRVECACKRGACSYKGQNGECDWKGLQLVMKLSFLSVTRPPEAHIIKHCTDKAAELKHDWVLNHLPKVYWSFTQPFSETSVQSNLEDKLGGNYEERVLRGIIQEELFNILELTDIREFAQVFFDILQCHEWVFKYPRVLHCDISQANIMFRRVGPKEQLHGVLNDFDLATILDDPDYPTPSSKHRTGTKPYMAYEQQEFSWQGPLLYRHDLESIFYVILILVCHYRTPSKPAEKANAPYRTWFTDSYDAVSEHKHRVLSRGHWEPPVQEFFKLLGIWLERIRFALRDGIVALETMVAEKRIAALDQTLLSSETAPFDEAEFKETFGGRFSYDVLFTIMRRFDKVDLLIKNPERL